MVSPSIFKSLFFIFEKYSQIMFELLPFKFLFLKLLVFENCASQTVNSFLFLPILLIFHSSFWETSLTILFMYILSSIWIYFTLIFHFHSSPYTKATILKCLISLFIAKQESVCMHSVMSGHSFPCFNLKTLKKNVLYIYIKKHHS